jgi:hypothetical protein
VVILVILHSIITLLLDSMTGVMGTISVKAAVLGSLSLVIDLTWYFVLIIIVNAVHRSLSRSGVSCRLSAVRSISHPSLPSSSSILPIALVIGS